MRMARAGLTVMAFLCGQSQAVFAQNAEPSDPNRWTASPEGNRHEASGILCLDDIAGFAPLVFMEGDAANLLGACSYIDHTGTGDAGVRVRRYARGKGETQEAIDNDRALVEPDPARGAPLFTVRMAPATTGDGKRGGRVTITKMRNGYLVDCFAEGATLQVASAKLARVCPK
jgi:hypothetical protein